MTDTAERTGGGEGRLAGRIALITGASRGIGRALALAFAREGAHLVVTARTKGALEEVDDAVRTAGGVATLVPLDLTDGEKIDGLGPTLYQRFGRLDILIANAGVLGPLSPLSHIHDEDWQMPLDVNLMANWRLIRTLEPLLRRSDAGRAVFVTSGAARDCNAYWGPYSVSKAGLEALVKTWAVELDSTRIRANLLNPGPVRTSMRACAFPGEDPARLPAPEELAPLFIELSEPSCTANGALFTYGRKERP